MQATVCYADECRLTPTPEETFTELYTLALVECARGELASASAEIRRAYSDGNPKLRDRGDHELMAALQIVRTWVARPESGDVLSARWIPVLHTALIIAAGGTPRATEGVFARHLLLVLDHHGIHAGAPRARALFCLARSMWSDPLVSRHQVRLCAAQAVQMAHIVHGSVAGETIDYSLFWIEQHQPAERLAMFDILAREISLSHFPGSPQLLTILRRRADHLREHEGREAYRRSLELMISATENAPQPDEDLAQDLRTELAHA